MTKIQFNAVSIILLTLLAGCGGTEEKLGGESLSQAAVFVDDNMTGEALFTHEFIPSEGLGPNFNAKSCFECHGAPKVGGASDESSDVVFRIGSLVDGVFSDLSGEGGPSSRAHSVTEEGYVCDVTTATSKNVNVISLRKSMTLFGLGSIEAIPDALIEAEAVDKGFGIHGKVNKIQTGAGSYRVGKFGWKAQKSDLKLFIAEAFRNEIGMTNYFFPTDNFSPATAGLNACDGFHQTIEMSKDTIDKVHDFVTSLPIEHAGNPDFYSSGYTAFQEAKCDLCHKPSYSVDNQEHFLFSDLLLHNMGDGLNDNFVQESAKGMDWRTAPLHGLGFRTKYLHDARTDSLDRAIREHRGEAEQSTALYLNFSQEKKNDLINFLNTL